MLSNNGKLKAEVSYQAARIDSWRDSFINALSEQSKQLAALREENRMLMEHLGLKIDNRVRIVPISDSRPK